MARLCSGQRVRWPHLGKVELTADLIRILYSLHPVRVADLARRGRAKRLSRFAIPAFHPGAAQPFDHRRHDFSARYFDPPMHALAWGVSIGGVAQLAFQLRAAVAHRHAAAAADRLARDEGVRRACVRAMGPALIGVSAAQIRALFNTQLAALLGDGRISWITYADRLMEFPTAELLGVALGTVAAAVAGAPPQRRRSGAVLAAARLGVAASALLLALPAAVALWLLGRSAGATLYQYGKFSVERRGPDARGACWVTARAYRSSSSCRFSRPDSMRGR